MRRSIKAQAAMEFLMTYGWAIIVVLIIIFALGYFGVFSPSTFLPEKCVLADGLYCNDYIFNAYTGTVFLNIVNGRGEDIYITKVHLKGKAMDCKIDTLMYPLAARHGDRYGLYLKTGNQASIAIPCDKLENKLFKTKGDINVTWEKVVTTDYPHVTVGEMLVPIGNKVWPTAAMCSRANTEGTCAELQELIPAKGNFRGFACECFRNYATCSAQDTFNLAQGLTINYVPANCPQ